MDYHRERFTDCSLMAYKGHKLISLLPCEVNGTTATSHRGLTFGGWLTPEKHFDIFDFYEVFCRTIDYFKSLGIKDLYYTPSPHIYSTNESDEDRYILDYLDAAPQKTELFSVIDLSTPLSYRYDMRKGLKIALNSEISVKTADSFHEFWNLLEKRLREKYNSVPTHSLKEIELLNQLFPDKIKLYIAESYEGELLGGTVIYISDFTIKSQYIATSERGRELRVLPLIIRNIYEEFRTSKRFFDLGSSFGCGRLGLNEGVLEHKYGLGATCHVNHRYHLKIQ